MRVYTHFTLSEREYLEAKLKEGKSFRQIAKYFQKYHKFEISHSMIQKTWHELEHTKEEKGNVK